MAFTSCGMSRGKVYELHLRIHGHGGLHILRLEPNPPQKEGQISPIVCRNWGMEVSPEASTAMGMAFPCWGMSRGKVYELHLRIHDHKGLSSLQLGPNCRPGRDKICLSFAGFGAWESLLRPPLPQGWLLLLGGYAWARFMSVICKATAIGASNKGQSCVGAASLRTGKLRSSFAQ